MSTTVPSGLVQKSSNGTASQPHARGGIGQADNAGLLEDYYEQWKTNPESVDITWRSFFEGFELGLQVPAAKTDKRAAKGVPELPDPVAPPIRLKQARLYNLLFAFRTLGHRLATLDPLGFNKTEIPELGLENFRFTEADLDSVFDSGTLAGGGERTLGEILAILKETYCGNIGVEYMHMQVFTERRWLRDKIESSRGKPRFTREKKQRILTSVLRAEEFESFLHTRYVGQKRFSLEGGETLIPMLDAMVEASPRLGISQIVMGMAHRGRLNVLTNILGKDYKFLLNEFAENYIPQAVHGDGDVKYHLGYDAVQTTASGDRVGISLAPNPSHLEAVDPVVQGKARAYQRILNDTVERRKVLPVLIHGDAAFAGQGVVFETINMSQLEGYRTGGTVHIVVNNQIGFTTLPEDARSAVYCTAAAKGFGLPIFHVNGDDPISAVFLVELALEYRQKFQRDVVIDLVCYRLQGHNEGDEPSFTQPTLYSAIGQHRRVSKVLLADLVNHGDITEAEAAEYVKKFEDRLNTAMVESKLAVKELVPAIRKPLSAPGVLDRVETSVPEATLVRVGTALTTIPESHKINAKIRKVLDGRRAMVEKKQPLDWGGAEALAFGTLVDQNHPVRLSGQDSRRGTFSHRHSVLYDTETRQRYIPLKHVSANQATFCVYNSPLSEYAVLGFDFGYTLDYPKILVLWEAQFGDFVNGAQTMIDQYITSSESKWGVTSNLVLLLPHGYHGQGPEHSSARLERFLQACAEDNIIVANCTTPANYFHILRRQALSYLRKPLVLMTPKGLLRDKRCVSALDELSNNDGFREIIPDPEKAAAPKRLILCSGKVYYDLADYRKAQKIDDVVLVRIEQLYPLHERKLLEAAGDLSRYEKIVWCQEESHNMGAWSFLEPRLRRLFGRDVLYAGRDASSSPATGALAIHELEQKDLVQQAFVV